MAGLLSLWGLGLALACLAALLWQMFRVRRLRLLCKELRQVIGAEIGTGTEQTRARESLQEQMDALSQSVHAAAKALRDEREETLQERSKLVGIMSHILSGVIVIDRIGRVLLVNAATERLLGLSEEDMVGRWHWEAGHHYGLASLVDEAISFGIVQKREVQLHKPQELTLEAHITPIKQSNGTIAGAVVLLHDISEWRRVERMRSDFVANVSHELRTPITALKGFAETLLDGALDDPETARQIGRAHV